MNLSNGMAPISHRPVTAQAIPLRRAALAAGAVSQLLMSAGCAQTAPGGAAPAANSTAIGNHAQPCWKIDAGAPSVSSFSVDLLVTTDSTGTVREAQVAPQDLGRMSDPAYAAFAKRALDAVMDYRCATLPLPSYMLGHNQTFIFSFSP
jgi:hypothetical protein